MSTHCRTGTAGSARRARCAAVSAMRRPPQEGQNPRPLARERHEAVVAAFVAAEAQEPVGEDAAAPGRRGAHCSTKCGAGRSRGSCAGEEGLELLANDAVQQCLLRRARRYPSTRGRCRPGCRAALRASCSRSDATRVPCSCAPVQAPPTTLEPRAFTSREARGSRSVRRSLLETLLTQ